MEQLKEEAIKKCPNDCLIPYLVYSKYVAKGKIAHIGFFRVLNNKANSYALNFNGRVMSPDVLLVGSAQKKISKGFNAKLLSSCSIKESKKLTKYLDECVNSKSKYSALEFNGINCAGFVEETMNLFGCSINCKLTKLNLGPRIPFFCKEDSP